MQGCLFERYESETNKKIEFVFFDCNVRINITDVEENRVVVELIMRTNERHFHLYNDRLGLSFDTKVIDID